MQTISLDQLQRRLAAIDGVPRVVVGGNATTPWLVLEAIDRSIERYRLYQLNSPVGIPVRSGVTAETSFVGPGMRHHPALSYVPSRLSMVPVLFQRTLPPDVVLLHCAPARDGLLSMGIEVNILPAAVDACRARGGLVIAVINSRMPYTFGDSQISIDAVDLAVEMDFELDDVQERTPDDESIVIAERLAAMIDDGSTLQMGIGAVPDSTLRALASRRGLRIWTELFSDGVLDLDAAHALDEDHVLTASFCFGSRRLYDWVDGNPRVQMLRTEKTNSPALIAANRQMTSVNSALEVDLFGQANASRINARIYSGYGGQTDFIVGALHSPGGQAFIALRSWHPRADCSAVVPLLDEPVTSFQQTAVVTEQGVAKLLGYDEKTQARHLIEYAAHPSMRSELWEEAKELGLA
ncbi:MAG TPA: acetyl-CoA hydrolase/transferase C-terminal domain-containing protein [Dermatophilaceae bacterium]|nr:acetyl-CoA hydrolase/transferase C-terminal domain-containing protein [Dermatophilaceae bacterium]